MLVKMRAGVRAHTARGLTMLEKQTKAAARECGKAFLATMQAVEQLGRVDVARDKLPVSDATEEVWDVEPAIAITYRDALFMTAIEVNKTLEREKDFGNDEAAAATRAQLEEINEAMRAMGDQCDLFATFEAETESEPDAAPATSTRQMELV